MEKIPNSTTLFSFVMENSSLENTELLRHIFREIVRINISLQSNGVWHRDCKPENILYCKNDRSLRFIDFGSAAPVQTEDFREFQVCFHNSFEIFSNRNFSFCEGNIRNYGTRMDLTETL